MNFEHTVIERDTPRSGHIPHNEALWEQARIAALRKMQEVEHQPMHQNALLELQTQSWLWKREPFRECIRAHFNCEPEELKYRDYSRAHTILSDISIFNQFHYEPSNPKNYGND